MSEWGPRQSGSVAGAGQVDGAYLPARPQRAPVRELEQEIARLDTIAGDLMQAVGTSEPLARFPGLPKDPLQADNELQRYIGELRAGYLRQSASRLAGDWLTPPTGRRFEFPGTGIAYDYAYDRQHPPVALERRLRRGGRGRRRKGGLLAGSGMAAIGIVLQSLAELLQTVRIAAFASYFETFTLFRLLRVDFRRALTQDELHRASRADRRNILYIEPVQYNWRLEGVDWDGLIQSIDAADDPPIVILDTTLCGASSLLDDAIDRLADSACPLLVCVRSGLKLDQEGLELANLGVVEWWPRPDCADAWARLSKVAAAYRTVAGLGLGRREACALAPRFVLNRRRAEAFAAGVGRSNRTLFAEVELAGGIFSHKTFASGGWEVPFVLFHLRQGGFRSYRELAGLIAREAQRRRLDLTMSGSFGFRTERFETILPNEQRRSGEAPEGVLKFACGSYRGPRFWEVVDMLNELAGFGSLQEAAQRWGRGDEIS